MTSLVGRLIALDSSLSKIKNKGFPENRMYSELRLWLDQPNGGPEDPELATHYYHDRARLEAVIAHSRRIGGPVLIRIITEIGRNVHSKATRFYFRRVKT